MSELWEAPEVVKAAGFDLLALSAEQISLFAARIINNGWFIGEHWRDPRYRWGLDRYPTAVEVLRKMTDQERATLRTIVAGS